MRVGLLTDAYPPEIGGVQIFAAQYASELAANSAVDSVDVLAFTRGRDELKEAPRVRRVAAGPTPVKLVRGLVWCREGSFDVVHALSLYPAGLIAAASNSLGLSTASFVTVYGLDSISVADHPVHRPLRQYIFNGVDDVLFFSDSTREKTHETYGGDFRSRTIYPGTPNFDLTSQSSSPDFNLTDCTDDFVVLTVARLVERKGIRYLLEAVADLPNVSLWVVGDGPERESLERLARARQATDRITFFGEVPHGSLPQFYERCDLFCLPSVYLRERGDIEGLGLVFLEAQQFGVPVIGTWSGGVPEAIADGESGFLVPERSTEAIRSRIEELREDRAALERLSEGARQFVNRKFSWERSVENPLEAYREFE